LEVKSSLNFYYDGQDSQTFGISNVSVSTGLYEEPFVASKEIIKQEIRGRTKPYHSGVKRSPIILNLSFAFNETWNNQKMRDVKNWLDQDFYRPLLVPSDPDDSTDFNKVYYCMLTSDSSKIIHNGLRQGYVDGLTFECNDSYCYSEPQIISRNLFNNPTTGTELIINNNGDDSCFPLIQITKSIETGTVSIFNKSNANKEMQIAGLSINEVTTIDCENQIIDSIYNNQNIDRFDSHNGYFLELLKNQENKLLIKGKCLITIQSEFKYK